MRNKCINSRKRAYEKYRHKMLYNYFNNNYIYTNCVNMRGSDCK